MDSTTTLEFNKIIEQLCDLAVSEGARQRLCALRPSLSLSECRRTMAETTETKSILAAFGSPPLAVMQETGKLLELAAKGAMLIPEQLTQVANFLFTGKRMKSYLKKAESIGGTVAYYGGSIDPLDTLYEQITLSIRNETVEDSASPTLRSIRRKIENGGMQVKAKLENMLHANKDWFTEGYVAQRDGHYVLPVKKEYRKQVAGTVIGTSSSGGTVFIEPASVQKLEEALALLRIDEENEIRRILYTLTSLVDKENRQILVNAELMESLDFLFAKAKLSERMKASPVPLTAERAIVMKSGRHPLLKSDSCVPLDFEIGTGVSGVVITGPNTGGKTVALKTVGLLSMMAQCGLHLPVGEGSSFCMHNLVLCDIGDGQSISENLSTFSAHIVNITKILASATGQSLVLLDELGSGTDPAEGAGIAVAVLEELSRKGCLFVVTTHYPEIKEYASNKSGLINARMAFDRESLRPLYRLELGEAGESCALYIAERLGFPPHLLKIAQQAATGQPSLPVPYMSASEMQAVPPMPAAPSPKLQIEKSTDGMGQRRCDSFQIGDCVLVYPQKETGIVFQTANDRGEIGVQIKKQKQLIPHKRLKLHVPASELYPPDYDFSILFDTVANRKARRILDKRYDKNAVIEYGDDATR